MGCLEKQGMAREQLHEATCSPREISDVAEKKSLTASAVSDSPARSVALCPSTRSIFLGKQHQQGCQLD